MNTDDSVVNSAMVLIYVSYSDSLGEEEKLNIGRELVPRVRCGGVHVQIKNVQKIPNVLKLVLGSSRIFTIFDFGPSPYICI